MDLGDVVARHIDLYAHWALRNVRLPCTGFRLSTVAQRFKHRSRSKISGGFEAVTLYRRAVATGDGALRKRLHEYNRDDLDALITVVEGLRNVVAATKRGSLPRDESDQPASDAAADLLTRPFTMVRQKRARRSGTLFL